MSCVNCSNNGGKVESIILWQAGSENAQNMNSTLTLKMRRKQEEKPSTEKKP